MLRWMALWTRMEGACPVLQVYIGRPIHVLGAHGQQCSVEGPEPLGFWF